MAPTRVLIVDDDPVAFERLRVAFEAEPGSFEIANAISAPRALGIVAADRPDAVIVDGALTGMDGYAFTAELKADDAISATPVVIVAAEPSEALALRARQVGAAAHLARDTEPDAFVAKIKSVLAGGGAPAVGAYSAAPTMAAAAVAGAAFGQPASAMASTPAAYGHVASVSGQAAAPEQSGAAPDQYAPAGPASAPGFAQYATASAEPQMVAPSMTVEQESRLVSDLPDIDDLLHLMMDRGASDLHIAVGSPPGLRLRGELVHVDEVRALTPKDTQTMLLSILSEEQRKRFENDLELDFAYSLPGLSRFRANIFLQRNSMGAVFRMIPLRIPTVDELNLPKVCTQLADRPRGLVLVTGPTGSGKSTTLAAMVDHINATRRVHIITLEDPIEFIHTNQQAYVNQREIGADTHSFTDALKRVLRQDPDVILVGEMRDLETIAAAITAAETGHLVLATLHTTGGPETIDRIIDVFPPHQQQQVRTQLAGALEGVLSQVLLRSNDGKSRVMAMEIMLGVPAICNLIREGKTHQMDSIIQGGGQFGMQTLDQHLKQLVTMGKVSWEEAVSKSSDPKDLAEMMGRSQGG